ncbi:MAG TPA: hypothetical protein VHB97_00750 [Polyangia bacterium]|nr:hypothetical protein [Polyangia bacterium]
MRLRFWTSSTFACAFAFAVVGCLPPDNTPVASTTAAETLPCADTCVTPAGNTTENPWAVAGVAPGYVVPVGLGTGYVAFGYDSTLTNLSWARLVPDCITLQHYLGTQTGSLQFTCPSENQCQVPRTIEIGQVGGGGQVPIEGGGNNPCRIICASPDTVETLFEECVCHPQPMNCDGAVCGSVSDGCGHTTVCGTCKAPTTCQDGLCLAKLPPITCHGDCI